MQKKDGFAALMRYAGRHKYLTFASLALSGVSALLSLAPFLYIREIVRGVIGALPGAPDAGRLIFYGWMAVLFSALALLVYIGALMCSHLAAFRVASNIRKATVAHALRLPSGSFDALGSGKVRKIIDESSAATETFLAHNLPDMVGAFVTPLALAVLLFVFDWRLGLACLLPAACTFLVMARMTGKSMREKMKQYQDALADMNNEAVEYVRGIPVVKTFNQTVFTFTRFKASIDRYRKWVVAYTKELRQPMMFFTLFLDAAFAFLGGAALIIAGTTADAAFTVDLVFYVILSPLIAVMLNRIMFMSENGMIVKDAMARIRSLLEIPPLTEPAVPERPQGRSVELKNVCFRYPGASRDALHGLSLFIGEGETAALVGESGGGKTTAAALVSRFWDVTEGEVKIGGANVRNIAKKELADTVSYVFQDSKLLKASIADNLKAAKPDATESEMLAALSAAQCGDILAKLPHGMQTVIGANGVYLSGGEQQRIAIARAILKNAPIIVLDEATAFADPENEYLVQRAFAELTKGKTVLMIAHRLSTVMNADKIFVLEGGGLAESGTHAQLLQKQGIYARMWKEYQTAAEWKVAKEA